MRIKNERTDVILLGSLERLQVALHLRRFHQHGGPVSTVQNVLKSPITSIHLVHYSDKAALKSLYSVEGTGFLYDLCHKGMQRQKVRWCYTLNSAKFFGIVLLCRLSFSIALASAIFWRQSVPCSASRGLDTRGCEM